MRLSINKKKIYFYLVSLILLSSIFNINIISNYENLIKVKDIEIVGLNSKEQKNIKDELGFLKNKNIFLIKKNDLKEILNDFNFIHYFIINKILPSKIELFIKKTNLIGVTYKNQNKFYIGENGKLIAESDLENTENLPLVFGKFQIDEFINLKNIIVNQGIDTNIEKYFYFQSKRWDIHFIDGTRLRLPFKNIEEKLKIFKILKEDNKLNSTKIIDLRLNNKIILSNEKK